VFHGQPTGDVTAEVSASEEREEVTLDEPCRIDIGTVESRVGLNVSALIVCSGAVRSAPCRRGSRKMRADRLRNDNEPTESDVPRSSCALANMEVASVTVVTLFVQTNKK